jgi:hypothetical protein
MLTLEYNGLRDKAETDHTKTHAVRMVEGLTLLIKLGCANVAAEHDVVYAGGPEIKDLSEEDARTLCELGWNDWGDDMGFTFFT